MGTILLTSSLKTLKKKQNFKHWNTIQNNSILLVSGTLRWSRVWVKACTEQRSSSNWIGLKAIITFHTKTSSSGVKNYIFHFDRNRDCLVHIGVYVLSHISWNLLRTNYLFSVILFDPWRFHKIVAHSVEILCYKQKEVL